jgi:hypothetical protein
MRLRMFVRGLLLIVIGMTLGVVLSGILVWKSLHPSLPFRTETPPAMIYDSVEL